MQRRLGFRQAVARGGDTSESRVPDVPVRSRTYQNYLRDHGDGAMQMARRWSSRSSPSPAIPRRSCGSRRPEACVDGGVDLAMEKGREHVQKMHSDERVQVRGKRGAGDRRSAAGVEVYRRRQCGSSSSILSSLGA